MASKTKTPEEKAADTLNAMKMASEACSPAQILFFLLNLPDRSKCHRIRHTSCHQPDLDCISSRNRHQPQVTSSYNSKFRLYIDIRKRFLLQCRRNNQGSTCSLSRGGSSCRRHDSTVQVHSRKNRQECIPELPQHPRPHGSS